MENKNFLIKTLLVSLVIIIVLAVVRYFDLSYPLSISNSSVSSELSVVGEGKVEVSPDTAYVDAGITVDNASTVDAAQKELNDKNNAIVDAVKKLGIKKEDIKTSNYSIYPNYNYDNGRNQNRINEYNGNVTISIRVKDVTTTSTVIVEVTKAGANQIQGTRFVVDKPEKYREDARDKAIANAKEQAHKLAKNLGIRLGRVTNIVESVSAPIYSPQYALKSAAPMAGGMGGGSPDIEPGSQTISSVVTLYFEKK